MEKLYTKREMAEFLRVTPRTISNYIKHGMPHIRLNNRIRFDKIEVMEWIKDSNNEEGSN